MKAKELAAVIYEVAAEGDAGWQALEALAAALDRFEAPAATSPRATTRAKSAQTRAPNARAPRSVYCAIVKAVLRGVPDPIEAAASTANATVERVDEVWDRCVDLGLLIDGPTVGFAENPYVAVLRGWGDVALARARNLAGLSVSRDADIMPAWHEAIALLARDGGKAIGDRWSCPGDKLEAVLGVK